MKLRSLITIVIIHMLITACEEPVNLPLTSEETNLVVVEGILTNENISHIIILSYPYKTQNGERVAITGAIVTVTEGNTVYPLTETPVGSGEYYTPKMRAVIAKVYKLSIQYDGKEYSAQDSGVPVEPLPVLQYHKVNDRFALTLNPSGQDANFINHNISWKNTATCISYTACEGKIVYYDLKTIDINEVYKPKKEDFNFPLNTTIIRTKYSVSPTYKNFLRSMLSETEWRGSVFDVQRADVPTNLSEGAIGFFAVSTVVSDTTVIVE